MIYLKIDKNQIILAFYKLTPNKVNPWILRKEDFINKIVKTIKI